jgi:hypothetical protein
MGSADGYQLSKEEKEIVKRWWLGCYDDLCGKNYFLDDEYNPHLHLPPPPLPPSRRGFNDIVKSECVIVGVRSFSLSGIKPFR